MTSQQAMKTRTMRVPDDLGRMLSAIRFADRSFETAAFVDPLIRPAVEERFRQLPKAIREAAFADATD